MEKTASAKREAAVELDSEEKNRGLTVRGKIVLLGGSPMQVDEFIVEGARQGMVVEYFESTAAMGFLGRFREYNAAIVYDALQPLSGMELAEYLEKLFQSLPMILLSDEKPDSLSTMPSSLVDHFPPDAEVSAIINRVIETLGLKPRRAELESTLPYNRSSEFS